MQLGAAHADSNVLTYASKMIPNLFRHVHYSDQLAIFFVEHGFNTTPKGASVFLSKLCPITRSVVHLRVMKGCRGSSGAFELFEVNEKTENLVFRIAKNRQDPEATPSLFPMEEISYRSSGAEFMPFSKETTLILFWDSTGSNDIMYGEQIGVYLALPDSIDKTKQLIHVRWIEPIGSFSPVSVADPRVDAIDLPVAPAFEPDITPLDAPDAESVDKSSTS